MDIITSILTGGILLPALLAMRMQWQDHDRATGGAGASVMKIAGWLWLISALFAGIAVGIGMERAPLVNRCLFGVLMFVGGYFLSLVARSLVCSMAERVKPGAPPRAIAPSAVAAPPGGTDAVKSLVIDGSGMRPPPPGAPRFHPSRAYAGIEAAMTGVALAVTVLVAVAYAATLVFPAQTPRLDIGAGVAALYFLWHLGVRYPKARASALARLCVVEPEGMHLLQGDAPIFIPWRLMSARTAGVILVEFTDLSGKHRLRSPGPIWTRHAMIPKPQDMEDPQAYADAIVRHAPEGNPLRVYVEEWLRRLRA